MEKVSEPKDKATVLYVDDEQQNLVSFRAGFRRIYNVLTAISGEDALQILKENQGISVVISDQRMPKMTGVELFEQVRQLYPDIMRIVLTGYSDVQDIINAISKGEVYRYITKPWNRDELKVTIDNAIEAYNLKVENKQLFLDLKDAYAKLEDHANMLEERVADRTKELATQNKELEKSRKKLSRKQRILEKQNEELLELDGEKNHLIGIVAHDLKSPLNQIEALLELFNMDNENLTEEQQEYIGMINTSIHRQQDMISQILDLNAIESKRSNIKPVPLQLGEMLKEAVDRFTLTAQKKEIVLHQDILKGDSLIIADENYIIQVFQNLISNAIKFSPAKRNIYISLKEEGEQLIASVKDEGPGLNEEDLSKLFGRFQKLSARPTGGEHSTGLGLSIVKRMVEEMNGQVWCESQPGEGANFMVSFKRAEQMADTPTS